MVATITVSLSKPVGAITMLGDTSGNANAAASVNNSPGPEVSAEQESMLNNLATQKNELEQLCQTYQQLIAEVEQFHGKLLAENKKEIAKLSVEIARKVLAQKVKDGDYAIESVVEQGLEGIDVRANLSVHLNPQDLEKMKANEQDSACGILESVNFVADANVNRAECIIETSNGTIQSTIDGHLEEIGKALAQTE